MLTESSVLKNQLYSPSTFDIYGSLVDSFVAYLQNVEKMNVTEDSSADSEIARETFYQMPLEMQASKLTNFQKYYDHCVHLTSQSHSLKDNLTSLKSFLFIYGLSIPSENEVFELLDKDVFAEIYDRSFLQIYRSPNWLETTSFGLKLLETQDWRNLFSRADEILEKQMEIVGALYSGKIQQPVHRPIQIHTVKELKPRGPYCCEIESLVYSPVYNQTGDFVGGLHLMKLHDLRQLDFQVYTESSL